MEYALFIVAAAIVVYGLYGFAERRKALHYSVDQAPRAFVSLAVGVMLLGAAVADLLQGAN